MINEKKKIVNSSLFCLVKHMWYIASQVNVSLIYRYVNNINNVSFTTGCWLSISRVNIIMLIF